jgi:hypothetical protein
MTRDPLAAARGIILGTFAGAALILFMLGAAFAATGSETAGAVCMILACTCSVLAIIVGGKNA